MQASFVQKQQLGLKMNPQMYQSLKLMELPLVDLREKIEEELERNPALEVLEDKSTVSLNEAGSQPREEEEYFEASSDSGFRASAGGGADADAHHRFIEGALSRPETLQQHLLWQLQLEPVDNELRSIAAILIQNLNDDGFHKEPPETLFQKSADTLQAEHSMSAVLSVPAFPVIPPPRLAEAMDLVRTLHPAGCCTADYRESLRVQAAFADVSSVADSGGGFPSVADSLNYLELFERGKFKEAAKKMKCGEEQARACFEIIKKLSPFPGRSFAAAEVRFVIPDIRVVRGSRAGCHADGLAGPDFVIIINNEMIPVLGIHSFFNKLAPGKKGGEKDGPDQRAGEFARENIKEARVFINSIAMRNHTLKTVAQAILEFQRPFFESGPQHLLPLTLGDIAEQLGVHETTVSRTAHGKYMQTEWGIFELRHFFTNSISGSGSGGSRFSKEGVKAIIQEIVGAESGNLSDRDIAEVLASRGIPLARRTVAKYRKELDLGSSYTR